MEFMPQLQSGVDELSPSLFEILSEQQLSSLLAPSLRYVLVAATHRHPRYLLRILNNFDGLYAGLMLLVERYYLSTYGGTFTEHFYGLKRERVLRIRGGIMSRAQLGAPGQIRDALKLRTCDIWKNVAVAVVLPYLKRKLDQTYEIHATYSSVLETGYSTRPQIPSLLPRLAKFKDRFVYYCKYFLTHIYPSIHAAYYFSLLACNLAYLFDSSKYSSPLLWLIGTRIRRLGEADHKAIALAAQTVPKTTSRPGQANSLFSPALFTHVIGPRLAASLKLLLPCSIFALKFLEWWHATDFARQLTRKANDGLQLPPPIVSGLSPCKTAMYENEQASLASAPSSEKLKIKRSVVKSPIASASLLPIFTVPAPSPKTSGLCPICTLTITNPTVSPYGFVYCYVCIHKWVEGLHHRQAAFMDGSSGGEEGWGEDQDGDSSRQGSWENGAGRDAVTGRRVLGGTHLLRRVVV